MKREVVGIIGISGQVGKRVIHNMKDRYNIRGGQRNIEIVKEQYTGLPNIEILCVDIFNSQELKEFCIGCTVVVNCAGPSFSIGARVAEAATLADAIYVDVYGSINLKNLLMKNNISNKNVFILSAGAYPGFSEILPLYVMTEKFDEVSKMQIYVGNKETIGYASAVDYVLSAKNAFGISEGSIKNCEIVIESSSVGKQALIDVIGEKVLLSKYLFNELKDMAINQKISNICFYNIIPEDKLHQLLFESCREVMEMKDMEEVNLKIQKAVKEKVITPWFVIGVEAIGTKNHKNTKINMMLKNKDSYEITAKVLEVVIEKCIKNTFQKGIYWAHEYVDSIKVVNFIINTCDKVEIFHTFKIYDYEEGSI